MTESHQHESDFDGMLVAPSIDTAAFWLDLLDRTGKTFIQTLLIFLAGGATIASISWGTALSSAALAALVSFLIALSTSTAISSGNFLIDLTDRVGRTFVGALVGAIPATGTLSDIDWPAALILAASAALVSALTSLATVNIGTAKGLPTLAPVPVSDIAIETGDLVDTDTSTDIDGNHAFGDDSEDADGDQRHGN
ncbi:holin [Rhodococcus sp. BH5]|uniref:holin n=1 Tax=Rhodococcus sp. BH5 TaxID=2871702 RepID=UPI0022CD6A7E|nr:holin [Rhodococcus sp. BH5]MCZ9635167.1 holin [Rhodococcus sp. BH5]